MWASISLGLLLRQGLGPCTDPRTPTPWRSFPFPCQISSFHLLNAPSTTSVPSFEHHDVISHFVLSCYTSLWWTLWSATQISTCGDKTGIPPSSILAKCHLSKAHSWVPPMYFSPQKVAFCPSLLTLERGSLHPMALNTKAHLPCLCLGHLWRAISTSELPVGSAEVFVASQFNSSFCPVLVFSVPHRCVLKNSPHLTSCSKSPSQT